MDIVAKLGENVGEFNADGSVKEDVIYCAFTGQFVRGVHSNRERIGGTNYFYRVSANELHAVTDEWRSEFAAAVKSAFGEVKSTARDLRRPDKLEPKSEA